MKHYVVTVTRTYRFEAKSIRAAKKHFENLDQDSDFYFEAESVIVEEETGKEENIKHLTL